MTKTCRPPKGIFATPSPVVPHYAERSASVCTAVFILALILVCIAGYVS